MVPSDPHSPDSALHPAMAAGVTGQLWELADMVQVLEAWETAKDA